MRMISSMAKASMTDGVINRLKNALQSGIVEMGSGLFISKKAKLSK